VLSTKQPQGNTTDKIRVTFITLFAVTVICALAGWWLGKDVNGLDSILMWLALGSGIGEASNIGKRATFNEKAMQYEQD
jgi:FtsH-binding integral membrane protein